MQGSRASTGATAAAMARTVTAGRSSSSNMVGAAIGGDAGGSTLGAHSNGGIRAGMPSDEVLCLLVYCWFTAGLLLIYC